jgi:hypothetical protein
MKLETLLQKYEPLRQAAIDQANALNAERAELLEFFHGKTPVGSDGYIAALEDAINNRNNHYRDFEINHLKALLSDHKSAEGELTKAHNNAKALEDELKVEVEEKGAALLQACAAKRTKTEEAIREALKPFYIYNEPPVAEIVNNCCVVAAIEQDARTWRIKTTPYAKAKALVPLLKKYNV